MRYCDITKSILCCVLLISLGTWRGEKVSAAEPVLISTFEVEVTPPLGSPLCNGNRPPAVEITTPLSARGIVLQSDELPIVLCAFDWVGIANGSYDEFRETLAKSTGTTSDRVAVHTLHQHDAPGSDFL
ncbi:MAG: hypothetical protein KDA65_02360, partial [Planctomycetaceae bacterium]|nr:hypothetical protein [Planctomycetaceae bacterium]